MGLDLPGKKIHGTPVTLLYDEASDPEEFLKGLVEARLFNLSSRKLTDPIAVNDSPDVHIVLLSGLSTEQVAILTQLVEIQRARKGVVIVLGRNFDRARIVEVLRLGVAAVLPAEFSARRVYRCVASCLQKMRRGSSLARAS